MNEELSTTRNAPSTGKSNGKWTSKDISKEAGKLQDEVSGIQDQVMTTARKAYDSIVENASGLFSKVSSNTSGLVRQYPVQTAVGALAVGFLLGAAISRRSE